MTMKTLFLNPPSFDGFDGGGTCTLSEVSSANAYGILGGGGGGRR